VGGSQLNTLITCRELSRMGYPSAIVTGSERPPEGDFFDLAEEWGVPVHVVPSLRRSISPLADLSAALAIRRILLRGSYGIIHTHSAKVRFLGRIAGRTCPGVKVVQTAHGWPFFSTQNERQRRLYIRLERLGFGLAHRTIVVTPNDIDKGVRQGIGRVEDYTLIRSGVEFEAFRSMRGSGSESRRLLGIGTGVPVVGTVTRLCEQKSPDHLVETAARVCAALPDTLFVVVGDGPMRAETERWIDEAGIRGNVMLLGSRKDVHTILPAFDVFFLPSRHEGLPRALLEALAAGLPAVCTDVGGIPELLRDGRNGITCSVGDTESLAEALLGLLSSPDRRAELVREVDRDLEPFSAGTMVEALFRMYTEVVER